MTVHISDDEAADIWVNEIGVDPARLSRLDEDNFWQMGDTGPCGPCTEIFWDHGEDIPGGPPGSEDDDLDRYIEIWNLVFMQFERDASGKMTPLPKPSIDTGMGLERIAAVMQGVHNNYDIDLFQHLIKAAGQSDWCHRSAGKLPESGCRPYSILRFFGGGWCAAFQRRAGLCAATYYPSSSAAWAQSRCYR